MRVAALVAIASLAACSDAHRDDVTDARIIDGPATCGGEVCDRAPLVTCLDGDTLHTSNATCEADRCTYPEHDVECGALGCCSDPPRSQRSPRA